MKRFVVSLVAIILIVIVIFSVARIRVARSAQLIGIVQFVHHPLLDETHRGLMSELEKLGLNDGTNFYVETKVADKDVQISRLITQQFIDEKASLIIAIATPSAQTAASIVHDIPVVFAAITDPIAAGLVDSIEKPGRNLTGTSNLWPFEKQIELIPEILPFAKIIGVVWNPGEVNSQAAMGYIRPILKSHGYELVEAPVANTADVAVAVKNISSKVDAFLMIPDNTTLAASTVFAQIAVETKTPLIGGDMDTVRRGSLATYGYNYFELGQVTARMVNAILKEGKQPQDMPVQYPPSTSLIINRKVSKQMNIELPKEIISEAMEIVD